MKALDAMMVIAIRSVKALGSIRWNTGRSTIYSGVEEDAEKCLMHFDALFRIVL